MANFNVDQAEGLRRMLAGAKPRIFTFLSALPYDEKNAMLVNLGESLVRAGSDVLLLDACMMARGVGYGMGMARGVTLLEVARQEKSLNEALQLAPQGFNFVRLVHMSLQARAALQVARHDANQIARLTYAFDALVKQNDIVLVDGELDKDDAFPLSSMASGEIVVQVSNGAASIKSAYSLIKRLHARMGRRPFSVLVTGTAEKEAQLVYQNMAEAAHRYLGVHLNSMGSVPADEHLKRATNLGRTVVDAFPLAMASIAYRSLAGRCALSEAPMPGFRGMQGNAAGLGL